MTGFNTLIIGPSAVGKSMLMRNYAVKRLKDRNFSPKFINMNGNTQIESFKIDLQFKL
jgi:GTPase SAR1 family protein